jgi:hypothetical protein
MKSILLSIILFFITTFAFAQPVLLGTFEVLRVVDGDTIIVEIDNQKRYVRLIGADTPETVKRGTPIQPFGLEATAFTKKVINDANNQIIIKYDIQKKDGFLNALKRFVLKNDGDIYVFIVTNQGGINMGYVEETACREKLRFVCKCIYYYMYQCIDEIHLVMNGRFCPSLDKVDNCRKPNTGMLEQLTIGTLRTIS